MSENPPPPEEPQPNRRRDLWQLHIPLVLALGLCISATVIEVQRAGEGVARAWAYMFEWPLIGLFVLWIWNHYRKEGNVTTSIAAKWRDRIDRLNAEVDLTDEDPADRAGPDQATDGPADPELAAWQAHVRELRRSDPRP